MQSANPIPLDKVNPHPPLTEPEEVEAALRQACDDSAMAIEHHETQLIRQRAVHAAAVDGLNALEESLRPSQAPYATDRH